MLLFFEAHMHILRNGSSWQCKLFAKVISRRLNLPLARRELIIPLRCYIIKLKQESMAPWLTNQWILFWSWDWGSVTWMEINSWEAERTKIWASMKQVLSCVIGKISLLLAKWKHSETLARISILFVWLGQNFFISWFTGFFFSELGSGEPKKINKKALKMTS